MQEHGSDTFRVFRLVWSRWACAGIDPVAVKSIELIAEADLLRRDKAHTGVVEFEASHSGSDRERSARPVSLIVDQLIVNEDLIDRDWRRDGVAAQMLRIDHRDALKRGEPHLAVASFHAAGCPPLLHSLIFMPSAVPSGVNATVLSL